MRQAPDDGISRTALAPAPPAPVIRLHYAAGKFGSITQYTLPGHLQAEVIQTTERGQIRAGEGSVGHVEVLRVEGVRTPTSSEDLDTHPGTNAPTPSTPSTVKSRIPALALVRAFMPRFRCRFGGFLLHWGLLRQAVV